jgi:nucleotide-binding universal stress UspA family protein
VYERILVPLDGSALAETALVHAVQMAEIFQAELILLRVAFVPTFPGSDTTAAQHAALAESEAYLERIASALSSRGLTIHTVVRSGKAAETIVEHALQQKVSVIVMATHGHHGVDQWPLGSIADKVLRSMQVPVLLIRPTPDAKAS